MKKERKPSQPTILLIRLSCIGFMILGINSKLISQSISAYNTQSLSFGVFSQGSTGGSISILPNGTRTASGSIIPLNFGAPFHEATFEIEGPAGTIVSILSSSAAILNGNNGGTMYLHIDNSNPSSPFNLLVSPPGRNIVKVGGTLTIGTAASNPPGLYTGSFFITFNQE